MPLAFQEEDVKRKQRMFWATKARNAAEPDQEGGEGGAEKRGGGGGAKHRGPPPPSPEINEGDPGREP